MIMSRKTFGREAYQSPICIPVEISLEGILCESFDNETYESGQDYGDGSATNGWY